MRSIEPTRYTTTSLHTKAAVGGLVLVLLLALAWLSAKPTVAAPPAIDPTLPSSKLILQNLDFSNWMRARVKYYDGANGQLRLETTQVITPGRSLWIYQGAELGLPTSYAGSAAVDSDMPFGMVVFEANGNASTLSRNFKADGYTLWSSGATDLMFPQLLKNLSGWNSSLLIHNSNPTATAYATLRLKNWESLGGQEFVRSNIPIPPGGSYTTDFATEPALSSVSEFYGRGHVTATLPITVLAYKATSAVLSIQPGLSSADASTSLYFPQLLRNGAGPTFTYYTGPQAMTVDGTPADFTFTYRDSNGVAYVESWAGQSAVNLDLRSSTVLPNNFWGSGVLTSNKPIVAIANMGASSNVSTNGNRAAVYRGIPPARSGPRLYLPFMSKYAVDAATGGQWSSGVWLRLAGGSATTVTLTYYLSNGLTLQQSASVTSNNPMATFDPRYFNSIPNGSVFTGVLTTNPPQPIAAVVSVTASEDVTGDGAMMYEGIAQ